MLKRAKQVLLNTAYGTGILGAVADSEWRRRRLLILCYHSVSLECEHQWRPALYFEPAALEARLNRIETMGCHVLSLNEAVERSRRGTLPKRAVALTFDDGMYDFWSVIWPMLVRRGWPATLYVSTYYAEKRLPVFHLLCSYLLWCGRGRVLAAGEVPGIDADTGLLTAAIRKQTQKRLALYCEENNLDASARDALAFRLASALGLDGAAARAKRLFGLMTPEEMAQAVRQGVDIQLHTHRHRTPRDRTLFLQELDDNQTRIADWTGRQPRHFCYPSGVHYPEFLPWLRERGVMTATTCVSDLTTAAMDPLLLPRLVDTSGLSGIEFDGWLTGMSHFFPQRPVQFG